MIHAAFSKVLSHPSLDKSFGLNNHVVWVSEVWGTEVKRLNRLRRTDSRLLIRLQVICCWINFFFFLKQRHFSLLKRVIYQRFFVFFSGWQSALEWTEALERGEHSVCRLTHSPTLGRQREQSTPVSHVRSKGCHAFQWKHSEGRVNFLPLIKTGDIRKLSSGLN